MDPLGESISMIPHAKEPLQADEIDRESWLELDGMEATVNGCDEWYHPHVPRDELPNRFQSVVSFLFSRPPPFLPPSPPQLHPPTPAPSVKNIDLAFDSCTSRTPTIMGKGKRLRQAKREVDSDLTALALARPSPTAQGLSRSFSELLKRTVELLQTTLRIATYPAIALVVAVIEALRPREIAVYPHQTKLTKPNKNNKKPQKAIFIQNKQSQDRDETEELILDDKIPQASAESRDSRGESAPEQRSLTPAQIVENGSVSSGGEDIPPLLGVDRVASSTPEPPASVGPSQPSLDEVNETEHRTDIAQPAGPGEIDETTPKAHKALGEEEDVVVQLVAAGRLSIADKPSKQALKRQRQRQKKENQNQHVVGATFSNATAVPSQAPKRASPATGSRQEEGMLLRPQIRPVNDEATPSVSENEPVETVKHSAAGDAPRLALTSRDADTLLEGAFKRTKHKKGAVNKADDKLTVSPGNHAEQKAVQEGVDQSILDDIPEKADGHVLMKPEAEEEPCHGMQSADVTADDVAPTTADHHTNDSEGFVVSELGEDDLGVGDSDEFVVRELAYSDIDDNYSHAMVDVGRGQNEEIDIEIGQEAVDSRAATEEPVEQLSIARATSPPPLTEEGIIQMGDLNDAGLELYIETQHKVCTATEEDLECRSQKSATVNLGRAGEEEVGEVFETVDLAPEAGATTNDDGVFESACDVTALIKHKALHIVPLTNEDVDGGEGERNTMNEVDVLEGANDAEAEAVATLEVLRVVSQPDEDVAAKNKPEVFAEEEVEALSAADHSEPLTEETENLITTNEPISMVEGDQLHAVNEGSESLAETEKAHINVSVREGVKKQTEALSTSDNSEGMTEVIDIPAACDRLQDPPVPEEAPAADQGHDVSTTGEKGVDLGKFAKEVVAPVEQGTKEQGEIGEAVITRQHSQEKRVEKLTVAGTEVPANEHVPVRKVMGSFIKPRTRSTEHERVSAEFNSSNTSALGTPTRSSHYSPQTSKVDRWAALGDRRRGFHPMSEDQARLNEAAAVHERSSEGSVEDLPVAACTTVVKEQTELQRVVDHKQKVSEAAKSSTQQDSGVSKQTIVREEPGATPKKMSWAEIVEEEEEEQRA